MIILLTGVPGTGKTTLAGLLSKRTGWEAISANDVVKGKRLWKRKDRGALVADMGRLSRELRQLAKKRANLIIEGHLLCDASIPSDIVIVLRTNPGKLRRRMLRRGYPKEKIDDNVLAEALDYCTIRSERNFKNVYEIDTGRNIRQSLSDAMRIIRGKGEMFGAGRISWPKELEKEALAAKA